MVSKNAGLYKDDGEKLIAKGMKWLAVLTIVIWLVAAVMFFALMILGTMWLLSHT